MLAETFINPLNLPNLLTPFRYNLEIQYVIFSILFVSLLGYVLFTFLDYMGFLDKMLVLLGVFVILLFLFLVIKERDKLDELRLQEEAVDMEEELLKIDRDIELKKFLKKEAQNGIIYDKNDQRIETGKPDLAKVKNFQNDINRMEKRRKEIQDKRKGFDDTFLKEAKEYVETSTKSEMSQLQKENEIYEKQLRYMTGEETENVDKLVTEREKIDTVIVDLQKQIYKEKDDTKRKGLETRLEGEINKRTTLTDQIEGEQEELIEISARDRVKIDKIRRKLKENTSRQKEIGGLEKDRGDHYLLKQKNISEAEKEEREAREKYENLLRESDTKGGDDDFKSKLSSSFDDLVSKQEKLKNVEKFKKLNVGNEAVLKAENYINKYDSGTDSSTLSNKYRVMAAYNKLDNLSGDAEKAGDIAAQSVEMAELKGLLDASLSTTERYNLVKESLERNLESTFPGGNIAIFNKSNPDPATGDNKDNLKGLFRNASYYVATAGGRYTNRAIETVSAVDIDSFVDNGENLELVTDLFAKEIAGGGVPSGGDTTIARQSIQASEKANWGSPTDAYETTYSTVLSDKNKNVLEKMREEIFEDGNIKSEYIAPDITREANYNAHKESFENFKRQFGSRRSVNNGVITAGDKQIEASELRNFLNQAKNQIESRKSLTQEDENYKTEIETYLSAYR